MKTTIAVKVVPRAAADKIVGWLEGDVLKVRLEAPPQGGAANEALEAVLASALRIKKPAVTVAAGFGSARKRVTIEGLTRAEIVRRLAGR
jgi:hypothetical protein